MLLGSEVTLDLWGNPTEFVVRWRTPQGRTAMHREILDLGATMEEVQACIATVQQLVLSGEERSLRTPFDPAG